MNNNPPSVQSLPEDSMSWARARASLFFVNGHPSHEALTEQLALGARTLSAAEVEVISLGAWSIVASADDWFARARVQETEEVTFGRLRAFPELGQNCTRPEFLVTTFAGDVIVRGPHGVRIVKGTVTEDDPVLSRISESNSWRRVVAFRGRHA